MIIYHGSAAIVKSPRVIISEVGKDFGFGFYATDVKDQAIRWAIRKAKIEKRIINDAEAILNIYNYNEKDAQANLNIKVFTDPDLEWLDFILKCRSDVKYKHDYDIVIGNIADDNVGETVSFVMNGIMRKEDAVERLKFSKINNQICFCSEKSLQYLEFIKEERV